MSDHSPAYRGRPQGRPRVNLDWEEIAALCKKGCSATDIAQAYGYTQQTLYMRCIEDNGINWTDFKQHHFSQGNNILHGKQYEIAVNGDKQMLIWLGKNRLRQKDAVDNYVPGQVIGAAESALIASTLDALSKEGMSRLDGVKLLNQLLTELPHRKVEIERVLALPEELLESRRRRYQEDPILIPEEEPVRQDDVVQEPQPDMASDS